MGVWAPRPSSSSTCSLRSRTPSPTGRGRSCGGGRGLGGLRKRSRGSPTAAGSGGFQDAGAAGARRDWLKNLSDLMAFFVLPVLLVTEADELTGKHGQGFAHRLI